MSKIILILMSMAAFFFGYYAMSVYDVKVLLPKKVLSADTGNVTPTPSPVPSPTDAPTPTLRPTPTITPTPVSPTPTKVITPPNDLIPLFDEFSQTYGVDKQKLMRIADCESHFNRGVWSEPYAGMYQFTDSAWTKYRNMMGKDPNINLRFGARESIETAAFVLSIKHEHIWPVCSK